MKFVAWSSDSCVGAGPCADQLTRQRWLTLRFSACEGDVLHQPPDAPVLRVVDAILSGTHEPGTSHYELLRAFTDAPCSTRNCTTGSAPKYAAP